MKQTAIRPTGHERTFPEDDIIVSKTDTKGIITYANRTFLNVALYTEEEVLGQPHSMIRHPDMPRCIFKLLWDTIQKGNEIFAYVKNLAKNGDHYWVFAHVTPSFNSAKKIVGFHSNRRLPDRHQIQTADALYRLLKREEDSQADWKKGMAASSEMLQRTIAEKKMEYDEFVFSI
ncbi:MAG: PAS domain-containing protein [Acidobacteriia bacterium]|nr:PAS domain-containing protein [Terriglobia bacterium]